MRRMVDRVMEQPWVYRLWQAPFAAEKFDPVRKYLECHPSRRVLDVGCGPGTNAAQFAQAEYVGVDINEDYLARGRARYRGTFVQADVAATDLSTLGTFDMVLVNSFLHHLPDRAVDDVLAGITRVLEPGGQVHIMELVRPPHASLATLMAKLDRGRYARSAEAWQAHFERHFEPTEMRSYMVGRWLWSMLYFRGGLKTCDSQ